MRTEDQIQQLQYDIIKHMRKSDISRDYLKQLKQYLKKMLVKLKHEKEVYEYINTTYDPDTYLVLNFNKGLIETEFANNLTHQFFKKYYERYIGRYWYRKSNQDKLFNFCVTEEVGKSKSNTHHNILLNRNGMDLELFKTRIGMIANETGVRLSTSTNNKQSKTIHIQNIYKEDGCFEYCFKEMNISISTDNLIDRTEIIRED